MVQDIPQIDTLYQAYDRSLHKITSDTSQNSILNMIGAGGPQQDNSSMVNIPSDLIGSGQGTGTFNVTTGATVSGKEAFGDDTAGFFFGIDTDGIAKFNLGSSTKYIKWDGSVLTVVGGVSVSSLNIPDTTTASSFHVDTSGNSWWGTNVATGYASAPASILATGAASFSSIAITGGSISGLSSSTATDISLLSNTYNLVFSVTDADTIAWTSGTVTLSTGRTFTISAGNTGNMAALTYIYIDPTASSTVLQTTTTFSTAVGSNKLLIGTAQNHTISASFIPFNGGQPLIDGSNIGSLSIVAANIAASTITAAKLSVSQLSAITADLGAITAGSITINGGVASISSAGAAVFKSIQVGGSSVQYTLNDSGIFSFGDGSDGALSTSGNVTLTSDKYYTNLTINTGDTVSPAGYRIFVSGTLTLSGTGKIAGSGNNGSVGSAGVITSAGGGGGGGAALAAGYLSAGQAGGGGGAGGTGGGAPTSGTAGSAGDSVTNSLGATGIGGGAGASNGGGLSAGAGGSAGTATTSNVKLIANWHLATLLDISSSGSTVKFTASAGTGGGGGGAGGGGTDAGNGGGGGGGGSGSTGGIIAVYAKNIIIGASASIVSNGGNGANGGVGGNGSGLSKSGNGGGGGSGGNGGVVILVYNVLTSSGSITVTGGTAGSGGAGGTGGAGGNGNTGSNGSSGSAGVIYQFQLSL